MITGILTLTSLLLVAMALTLRSQQRADARTLCIAELVDVFKQAHTIEDEDEAVRAAEWACKRLVRACDVKRPIPADLGVTRKQLHRMAYNYLRSA